jgi:23S rRNA (cytosine1962-C5)-methyltransferase
MKNEYTVLDSGNGRKLEKISNWILDRQAPVAFWKPKLSSSEWKRADVVHVRSEKGGGHWEYSNKNFPESFTLELGVLKMKSKLTSFGHLGFFPEQIQEWQWLQESAVELSKESPLKIINLFGYTGGSSLALALGGAQVTHVDAAKGVVDWGKENQLLNPTTKDRIRWMVDDCEKFLEKEIRRGNSFDGFVMDPPTYGRGPKNEIFRIETHINGILEKLQKIVGRQPKLVHFSCHTPGWSPKVLENLCHPYFDIENYEGGDLMIPHEAGGLSIPSGSYLRKRSTSRL